MGYILTSPPSSEPLTLQEAKVHLQVGALDGSGTHPQDALITSMIAAVRQFAEQETQSSLITQSWRLTLDAFPGGLVMDDTAWGREFSIPRNAICLTKGPVSAITSITYTDMAGVQQTVAATDYAADFSGPVTRITPVFGKIWPIPLPQIGVVQVNFAAGYGNAAAVPEGIKTWMKLRLRMLYDNPGDGALQPSPFFDSLLDKFRIQVA